jgi:hypothetical protein
MVGVARAGVISVGIISVGVVPAGVAVRVGVRETDIGGKRIIKLFFSFEPFSKNF